MKVQSKPGSAFVRTRVSIATSLKIWHGERFGSGMPSSDQALRRGDLLRQFRLTNH
jgi:hypothetical protein